MSSLRVCSVSELVFLAELLVRGFGLSKYRTRLQIIADILEIVRGGAKKTHIMYGANLSYRLLCRYLEEILECGLARVDRGDCYVVASKGEKFLERYAAYRELREHVKDELSAVDEEKKMLEQMYTNYGVKGSGKKMGLARKG